MPHRAVSRAIRRRLNVAVAVPLALLGIGGAVLTVQVIRLSDASTGLKRTDEVLSGIFDVQREIVDQETGLRGYLLTGDKVYLEPFWRAKPLESFKALRLSMRPTPAELARLDELEERYRAWYALSGDVADAEQLGQFRTKAGLLERKERMDRIRDAFTDLVAAETDLRHERALAADSAASSTLWAIVPLFAVAGLVIAFLTRHQLRAAAVTFSDALESEQKANTALEEQAWVRGAQNRIAERLQGDLSLGEVGRRAAEALAEETGASVVAVYWPTGRSLRRGAGFALDATSPETFALGEGLVGEAALSRKTLRASSGLERPVIRSATGERTPAEVIVVPACTDGVTRAVLELGFLEPTLPRVSELLANVSDSVALAVRSAESKERLQVLLEESQRQGEELQAQQEELQSQQEVLRVTNTELERQRDSLQRMHGELAERKEELETSNSQLTYQRDILTSAQRELATKAAELEKASRYKSEFLANMSHELRTPLNSSLILARLLADNKHGNLNPDQVKYAETIYSAGNDLLELINDILDLSKIEAGRAEVVAADIPVRRLVDAVTRTFEPVARDKDLAFLVEAVGLEADGRAVEARVDEGKVSQILRNLLSNALKFTERGKVSLRAEVSEARLVFSVADTGIGIPADQHEVIFEAFRQAEATTNRRFGGTGLGLSISRDLARLLGGELTVQSAPGVGSTFRLELPRHYQGQAAGWRTLRDGASDGASTAAAVAMSTILSSVTTGPELANALSEEAMRVAVASVAPPTNGHGTADATPGITLLIVEDDPAFADILRGVAIEKGFSCVMATTAEEAIAKTRLLRPNALLLDMHLPDHGGLSVLDSLKRSPDTRHIPVHVITVDDVGQRVREMGAVGFLRKPASHAQLAGVLDAMKTRLTSVRRLLLVEDDSVQRGAVGELLDSDAVHIDAVGTVREALERLGTTTYDCVVVDLALPDASGFELLERMAADERLSFPPVIVYTGRVLSPEEEHRLRRYSSSIIVKGARSPERLLDEVTLFLHQVESELPADGQRMLRQARQWERAFEGKAVMVVEDDVRNVFALTSVLEPRGARLILARNGREALDKLETEPRVDLILMDVMMPEMDGLEATRAIRALEPSRAAVPIIALTAKAMPDDQVRCLEAGANDYLAKPLDLDMLLSMCRVWIQR